MLSCRNLYPKIVVGENLKRLLRPGRVCTRKGKCGWLVVRKRRNKYYVYLQWERGTRDIYLGPIEDFPPHPVKLISKYDGKKVVIDIDISATSVESLIGIVRGIEILIKTTCFGEVLQKIIDKYKLRGVFD